MTSDAFDYYRELEVDRAACPEVIKAAYSALARIHHTDTNPDSDGQRIKRITVAYSCLRDPDKRAEYDAELGSASARDQAGARQSTRGQSDESSTRSRTAGSDGAEKSSGRGPLRCEKCGRRFKSQKGLAWHRENFTWCASSPKR